MVSKERYLFPMHAELERGYSQISEAQKKKKCEAQKIVC